VSGADEPQLPVAARARLAHIRDSRFFTSDLTTNEFLLVRESGFRPVTQVMGSCFYHVGWQAAPGWGGTPLGAWQGSSAFGRGVSFELENPTEAWNEARRLAVDRLEQEARLAGADAVVGVRLERGAYDWAAGLLEFVVTGTAVVSERYAVRADDGRPLLSNLSGSEFAALFRHGWSPVGLVAGTTVCYIYAGWRQQGSTSWLRSRWTNQELPDFTRGLYDARTQAMLRVTRQAHELGAQGIVGVRFDRGLEEREGDGSTNVLITVHVLGTAVVEVERRGEDPPVYIALPL
jgi:uncharacterized protein YbjQ (UPF0145 family)